MAEPDEHVSITMRRISGTDIISPEIAMKIAEMLFDRHYGKEVVHQQLPLIIIDRNDRWEITGERINVAGQRLKVIIMKANGQIVELFAW